MYWTLELASYLSDAPWPATKEEIIDYAYRTGAPMEVVENLESLEDEGEIYESIEEIWPDYPTEEDYLWNEEELLTYYRDGNISILFIMNNYRYHFSPASWHWGCSRIHQRIHMGSGFSFSGLYCPFRSYSFLFLSLRISP